MTALSVQCAIHMADVVKGYCDDIEGLIDLNKGFRHVLYTGKNLQLVLMSLKPGQDIGAETHATHDQFFRVEKGKGEIVIDGFRSPSNPAPASSCLRGLCTT